MMANERLLPRGITRTQPRKWWKSFGSDAHQAGSLSDVHTSFRQPLSAPSRIRLLRNHSQFTSDSDGRLRCHLFEATGSSSWGSDEEYYVLSYVWGQMPFDQEIVNAIEEILCNDILVEITANLHRALTWIWSTHPNWLIWADALCINQADNYEKSSQVAMMDSIYANAALVIVWLGDWRAYQSRSIGKRECSEKENGYEQASLVVRILTKPGEVDLKLHGESTLLALLDRLTCKLDLYLWFTRAWTFQELLLARDALVVFYGHAMDWKELVSGCRYLDFSGGLLDTTRHSLRANSFLARVGSKRLFTDAVIHLSNAQKSLKGGGAGLRSLAAAKGDRDASDEKDNMMSLLGALPGECEFPGMRPIADYTASTATVFARAALYCMVEDGDLSILQTAGLRRKDPINGEYPGNLFELQDGSILPSWVPDWARCSSDLEPVWTPTVRTPRPKFNLPQLAGDDMLRLRIQGTAIGLIAEGPLRIEPLPLCTKKKNGLGRIRVPFISMQFHSALESHEMNACTCPQPLGGFTRLGQNTTCSTTKDVDMRLEGLVLPHMTRTGDLLCCLSGSLVLSILRPPTDIYGVDFRLLGQIKTALEECADGNLHSPKRSKADSASLTLNQISDDQVNLQYRSQVCQIDTTWVEFLLA